MSEDRQQKLLHERAIATAREYLSREAELVGILQELDRRKTFLHYEMPSLFMYATKLLGLSESAAYALISVARKSVHVPELKAALEEKKITLSNARRIAPILNAANKCEWLEKAALPLQKLELELAKSFPKKAAPTRITPKSESHGRLEIDLPVGTLAKLRRAQDVLSQKRGKHVDAAEALSTMIDEFVARHDPLEKARRAEKKTKLVDPLVLRPVGFARRRDSKMPVDNVNNPQKNPSVDNPEFIRLAKQIGFGAFLPRRKKPSARTRHSVANRDQARCTHEYPDGARCENARWLQVHHVRSVANGGSDESSNLTTLCSAHHRARHR